MIETLPFSPTTITNLQKEMRRAIEKHGESKTPLAILMTPEEFLPILVEEVGEVARALTYDEKTGPEQLYAELIQVSAMALAYAQTVFYRDL